MPNFKGRAVLTVKVNQMIVFQALSQINISRKSNLGKDK